MKINISKSGYYDTSMKDLTSVKLVSPITGKYNVAELDDVMGPFTSNIPKIRGYLRALFDSPVTVNMKVDGDAYDFICPIAADEPIELVNHDEHIDFNIVMRDLLKFKTEGELKIDEVLTPVAVYPVYITAENRKGKACIVVTYRASTIR